MLTHMRSPSPISSILALGAAVLGGFATAAPVGWADATEQTPSPAEGSQKAKTRPSDADEAQLPPLPVRFAVAPGSDDLTGLDDWLAAQLQQANRIFAVTGVSMVRVRRDTLPPGHARLRTRRDRHRLGAHLRPHVINCFVVEYLEDVDEPGRERQGVHWRAPRPAGNHYVILSRRAGPDVLAHELGHFFGNRQHSEVPGNIMSYTRGPGLPHLDRQQNQRIQAFASRYLAEGELRPASAWPRPSPADGEAPSSEDPDPR